MSFELKDGQGTLFKNDKGDNEKRPDYRGEINIGGTVYELASWVKTSQKGNKFMSISAKPKDDAPTAKPAPPKADYDDSDLPF